MFEFVAPHEFFNSKYLLCCNCFRPLQNWVHAQCCYGNASTNCFIHARNACTPLPYCCSSLSVGLVCVVECVVSVWRIQSASLFMCCMQCFTMLQQCVYGRKPFMNQPFVGALTLVVVLVCSCVHGRSVMKVFRHASMSALHNCDMRTTVTINCDTRTTVTCDCDMRTRTITAQVN